MRVPYLQTGWRHLVPLGVVAIGAVVATGVVGAGASTSLPALSATALLADLRAVGAQPYSGTVVQKSSLGLPNISSTSSAGDALTLASLLTGANTVKLWYGGPTKQRTAVLDPTGETDVFRDGVRVWQWQSSSRIATFFQSPATTDPVPTPVSASTMTPDQIAQQTLAAIGPTSRAFVDDDAVVAGRPVYRLRLEPPASSGTRIASVQLSLDAQTKVPLAAQVFARGHSASPAIDVSFTRIDFSRPDDATYTFTPPANAATVTTYDSSSSAFVVDREPLLGALATRTLGTGWTRVAVISPPNGGGSSATSPAMPFGSLAVPVSGTWGSGRLLQSTLLTALFVSDGRIVVGAVSPEALYAAAAAS